MKKKILIVIILIILILVSIVTVVLTNKKEEPYIIGFDNENKYILTLRNTVIARASTTIIETLSSFEEIKVFALLIITYTPDANM